MTDARVVAVGSPPTFRQQVARALQADPESVQWVPSVTAAEGYMSEQQRSPEVLVLSPAVKEPDAFGLAEFIGRTSPATAVLLVRDRTMNGLLPAAMRAGIRDVVDLSRGSEDLKEALERAIAWSSNLRSIRDERPHEPEKRGVVVSIFSSKGGTGKTFLAANLGSALSRLSGMETAVVDLDHDLGDVFSYFGKEPTKRFQDLLAFGDLPDWDVVTSVATRFDQHLWGFGTPPDPAAGQLGGEATGKILRALRSQFDFVVIDASAEYSDPVLAAFDLSDTICLITGLDVVGVRHLSLALQTMLQLGYPRERFRVVLNRADSKVGLTAADVERVMQIRVDGAIPSSRLVPISLNRGRPIYVEQPKSPVSRSVGEFAQKIIALHAAGATAAPARPRRLFAKS